MILGDRGRSRRATAASSSSQERRSGDTAACMTCARAIAALLQSVTDYACLCGLTTDEATDDLCQAKLIFYAPHVYKRTTMFTLTTNLFIDLKAITSRRAPILNSYRLRWAIKLQGRPISVRIHPLPLPLWASAKRPEPRGKCGKCLTRNPRSVRRSFSFANCWIVDRNLPRKRYVTVYALLNHSMKHIPLNLRAKGVNKLAAVQKEGAKMTGMHCPK